MNVAANGAELAESRPDAVPAGSVPSRNRRTLLLWLPVLVLVVAYVLSTALTTLPRSALADDLAPVTSKVMQPYFSQRWYLFAPDVPMANYAARLQVRYQDSPGGSTRMSPVLNLTDEAVRQAHGGLLARGEMKDMAVAFMETVYPYRAQLAALSAADRDPARFRQRAGRSYEGVATFLDSFQRYLSSAADREFPGKRILAVRGQIGGDPVAPFPQRGAGPYHGAFNVTFDSGWWPYASGVSRS